MAFGDIEEPEDPNIEHTFSDDFDGPRILDKNMYAWQVNDVVPETIRYTLSENPEQGDPIFGLITMTDHNNISTRGFYQSYNWNIYDQPTTTTVRLNAMLTPGMTASNEVMTRKVSEDVYVELEKEPDGLYIGDKQITPVENILTNTKKYNIDINTLLGNVDANSVLQQPIEQSDLVFTGVTDVASYGLYYRFAQTKVKSVSFPNLTTISGEYGCYNMFQNCTALTDVLFPNLTTISGSQCCDYMFNGCTSLTTIVLSELITINGNKGCAEMFYNCTNLLSISLPELTTISGFASCNNMFSGCTSLTTISLPKLTTISGDSSCGSMFNECSLVSISLPELTTISGSNGCSRMFINCSNLISASFHKLTTISGSQCCARIFTGCTALEDVYFPALTIISFGNNTNQFQYMLSSTGSTVIHTIHFPSNLESTIQGLDGYPLFGGTDGYVVLAFDLPATE